MIGKRVGIRIKKNGFFVMKQINEELELELAPQVAKQVDVFSWGKLVNYFLDQEYTDLMDFICQEAVRRCGMVG